MWGAESSSSVSINVEILETYLKSNNENICTICQIKRSFRNTLYDPVVVSIGPYHHGKDTLQAMEIKKWNFMDYALKLRSEIKLDEYVRSLKKVEHIARSYYGEEINMESNQLINMLLLDGFFILFSICAIEIAAVHGNQDLGHFVPLEEDRNNELKEALEYCFITNDIFLVENQIPFFVMKIIYELFTGKEKTAPSISEKISHNIEKILCHYPVSIKETNKPRDFHHLLHLCHIYLKPRQNGKFYFTEMDQDYQTVNYWHKANECHIAGIKLKKRELDENNPNSLLDVRFSKDVLEIPSLTIHENAPSFFKNLVALEQTNPELGNDITTYIIFMSHLIKDAKDVSLLVSEGIIEHDLRLEEEVADLFMRTSQGISFDFKARFYLKNICHDLEMYYQSRMKSWNVWFRQSLQQYVEGIRKFVTHNN